MQEETIKSRRETMSMLFPEGIPSLWCPMIVHYKQNGQLDLGRMEKHLQFMLPDVSSFLLFGSTGDGWELRRNEKETLLRAYAGWAKQYGVRMLLGVLHPGIGETHRELLKWLEWLKAYAHTEDALSAMQACGVVGFTICAPKGKELSQETIGAELEKTLQLGLPTAIYQLPQVTENVIAPKTLSYMAGKYPNFYLFKDTSGADQAILSGLDFGKVFFVRGMEGDYYDWFAGDRARYPGFLLSSANCFASLLKEMLHAANAGDDALARELSDKVQGMIDAVFAYVADLAGGNAFANTNKCFEHCLAYGAQWDQFPMPMRHCGDVVPVQYIAFAAQTLKKIGFMREKGYLIG